MGFPLPSALTPHTVNGAVQAAFLLPVFVLCYRMPVNGWRALLRLKPDMDSLVAVGVTASAVYSIVSFFTGGAFYFEAAGMMLALISFGKYIEAKAKKRTASALEKIINLSVPEATVLRNGKEIRIPAEQVLAGDLVVIAEGERAAVDGVVAEGGASFDESAVTGESIPSDKTKDSKVISGSVNLSGRVIVRALQVGEDSTINRIIKLMERAAAAKAPIARAADRVSGVFVPAVMALALITAAVWLIIGNGSAAFSHAVSVLVISCPCALGLATPSAITVGLGFAAGRGILFKDAAAMEGAGRVDMLALDKTGTLTNGAPAVTDTEGDIKAVAYALESLSPHPVARAVVTAFDSEKGRLTATDYKSYAGRGISAVIAGKRIYAGNRRLMSEQGIDLGVYAEGVKKADGEGKTLLIFGTEGRCIGFVAVADSLRGDAVSTVKRLKAMGIKTVMLTGDNQNAAGYIAKEAGIEEYHGGLLPDAKAEYINAYIKKGYTVAMVGDGINDAPSLACADLGISVMGSSDIAADASDVVLMETGISRVAESINIGKKALRIIKQNLFWALIYNTLLIPLAAGAFTVFGIEITPSISAAAMSFSSLTVVGNALRLKYVLAKNCRVPRKSADKTN